MPFNSIQNYDLQCTHIVRCRGQIINF